MIQNKNILIVEDEKELLQLLAEQIRDEGAYVDTATNGKEALSRFHRSSYDLVLSDICMEDGDGIYLLKEIRKLRPCDLPVLLMTGYTHHSYEDIFAWGANGVIQKPCETKLLLVEIERQLSPPNERFKKSEHYTPNQIHKVEVQWDNFELLSDEEKSPLAKGGFFVGLSDQDVLPEIGDVLVFRISFKDNPKLIFEGLCKVAWIRASKKGGSIPGYAVEILSCEERHFDSFLKAIQQQEKRIAYLPRN
jgi:CheY-like chemotaxis protein